MFVLGYAPVAVTQQARRDGARHREAGAWRERRACDLPAPAECRAVDDHQDDSGAAAGVCAGWAGQVEVQDAAGRQAERLRAANDLLVSASEAENRLKWSD